MAADGPSNGEGVAAIARTAYYDRIAGRWHRVTGHHGGPLKRYVLNDRVLGRIAGVAGRAILELGAGNGYFPPLLLRRFSGQVPRRLVISDQSDELLAIARAELRVPAADYLQLDVQRTPFPFEDASFDLVLAGMLFNELPSGAYAAAAAECARVLAAGGQLVATVPHPDFVRALARKGELTDFGRGLAAMPGAEGLRLPVSRRARAAYLAPLEAAGFAVQAEDVAGTPSVQRARPGLKAGRGVPLALLLDCRLPDVPGEKTPRG